MKKIIPVFFNPTCLNIMDLNMPSSGMSCVRLVVCVLSVFLSSLWVGVQMLRSLPDSWHFASGHLDVRWSHRTSSFGSFVWVLWLCSVTLFRSSVYDSKLVCCILSLTRPLWFVPGYVCIFLLCKYLYLSQV